MEVATNLVKILKYNIAQLMCVLSLAKIIVLEWGRGTGKSTILAKRIIDCVHQMPRSTGMIYGLSYKQIEGRTLPSTIKGLEDHGYINGIHFVVGSKPPKHFNWPTPYQPPLESEHCMCWYTGAVIIMVPQSANAASGRGLNIDWMVADEVLLLNGQTFMTDAVATIRGNLEQIAEYPDGTWKYYKDCALHHSIMLASSTPISVDGRWFFKYEEEAKDPAKSVLFLRASAMTNFENLGQEFFDNNKAIMPDFLYDAEVMNIRVSAIKDGFYPKLKDLIHTYSIFPPEYYPDYNNPNPTCEGDTDLNENLPLICGVDWGANINCMVITQKDGKQLKFINNMFVKAPKILDDLATEKFIPYYEPHRKKNNLINLFYDPSGNNIVANSRLSYAKQFQKILIANGWNCQLLTRGTNNQSHEDKYNLWNIILSGKDSKYPEVLMNKHNCKELLISMKNTPAKRGTKVAIQKVKNSEKRKGLAQEHATHFGDAADLIVVGLFMHIYKGNFGMPETRIQ
jgi:hypothetical protein